MERADNTAGRSCTASSGARVDLSRLAAILQHAPVGILIVAAPSGELLFANEECERILGRPLHPGASVQEWQPFSFHPDGSPIAVDETPVARALSGSAATRGQQILLEHTDGAHLLVSVYAAPSHDPSGAATVFAAFCDITDQKALEHAQRLSGEDLNHFAFAMAHDLQEPLRMVAGYTTLLERRFSNALGSEGREFLGYIAGGVDRMRRLMTDLLIWSQVTTSRPDMGEVDMNRVLDWALSNLRSGIEESGAEINRGALPRVRGDFARLAQLLQNLIANALKYSGATRPRIEITAEERNNDVLFSVRDLGIGIPPEFHESIFGLFRRLHGDEVPGTGVGLAVCRRIVERHGGRIWVESERGQGAAFQFTLPRAS